jgi:ubiquinone/menaquinone biosynthesis C-methylase UbiE
MSFHSNKFAGFFQCFIIVLLIGFGVSFSGCKSEQSFQILPPPMDFKSLNVNRDAWQKPRIVIDKLGDIDSKVIADIGAGTGYFTFRMALRNASIIAVEIDPVMIELIETFKLNLPNSICNQIQTRKGTVDSPLLKDNEVDIAVIINTITYLKNPEVYLKEVLKAIKPGGKVMIVDFKPVPLGSGVEEPNKKMKPESVVTLLTKAGFINIDTDKTSLEYQYIILAEVPQKLSVGI